MLISEEYGRSQMASNSYFVTPDEKIYNFLTYPGKNILKSNKNKLKLNLNS